MRIALLNGDLQCVVVGIGARVFGEDIAENRHTVLRAAGHQGAACRYAIGRRERTRADESDAIGSHHGTGREALWRIFGRARGWQEQPVAPTLGHLERLDGLSYGGNSYAGGNEILAIGSERTTRITRTSSRTGKYAVATGIVRGDLSDAKASLNISGI